MSEGVNTNAINEEDSLSLESLDSNGTSISGHEAIPLEYSDGENQHEMEEKVESRKSQAVSSSSASSKKVPRNQRRGLFPHVVLIPEYENAKEYPKSIKYMIVLFVALAGVSGPMGTSVMLPAIEDIISDLKTSASLVNVSVGVYLLSLGIFPMWWSTFSETYGRRSIYIVSFAMFFAFSIGAALAPNIQALIILRVLQGGCSASVQAVGAGTVSDIFAQKEMGKSMGIYYLGPLLAPFLAPIIGGIVGQVWGWRATQWVLVIISGVNLTTIVFGLPETLNKHNFEDVREALRQRLNAPSSTTKDEEEGNGVSGPAQVSDEELNRVASHLSNRASVNEEVIVDTIMPTISRLTTNRSVYSAYSRQVIQEMDQDEIASRTKSNRNEANSRWAHFKTSLYDFTIRPIHAVVLLRHPPVALVIFYSAVSFSVVYFFNLTIASEYAKPPYNFRPIIVGLMYIPNSMFYIIASILGGRWIDKLLKDYASKHNGDMNPESRISWNMVTAVLSYIPACLIFGWTLHYGEFWLVPLIGSSIFGAASMLVIGTTVTYLVDTLPGKGATGVALNNLVRMILAAVATFIVDPLIKAIGTGILFSILGGILVFSSVLLLILKRRGSHFRDNNNLGNLYNKL